MNDATIREGFHRKRLRRHHAACDTLVVDELGLMHGKCRADIAVINGHLSGYEIKSDEDTLNRLEQQAPAYAAVFDRATVVIGEKHAQDVEACIPEWWGIVLSRQGIRGSISFETVRRGHRNMAVDPFAVAQLLWRNEAEELLAEMDCPQIVLRQKRSVLYEHLAASISLQELRHRVSERLRRRRNWRRPVVRAPNGGLSRPTAKLSDFL
ncbi:MAG: sce7726 family protein [Verrucomicrobia bacterium]|jgi:hypothetical protein|nr:sce7726 family protein [Verrucomicrobiota bacterium]